MEIVENVYTVQQAEHNDHYGVFTYDNRLLVDCGQHGQMQADNFAAILNKKDPVIIFEFHEPAKAAIILSELYINGYSIISHVSNIITVDWQIIHHTVILRHSSVS